ncbi:hypothetical protein KC333_g2218 [Hortaea werneckii]|nr:hypothetical protein KC333_g2218 [Hortaea werneckii]KAI7315655.1 hypothetical protein KC326_g4628 [Hortaea werneckii]
MQPSARQQELERIYNSRKLTQSANAPPPKGHVPHISISDDDHHVTEAIGSYYDHDDERQQSQQQPQSRPLSFMPNRNEVYESRGTRRGGPDFEGYNIGDMSPTAGGAQAPQSPQRSGSYEKGQQGSPSSPSETGTLSPRSSLKRMGSGASDSQQRANGSPTGHASPPPLTRNPSSGETASMQFPLNDIDYESSPAAVAQELSNLQAIRRMSMNVDNADPDLPSFGGVVPSVAPKTQDGDDEDDASRLFWVPASVHPELAPVEFKTFIEDRVDKIRRRSGDGDSLSVEGLERSGSGGSSLRRKKSMLRREIDTSKPGEYEDGADRLERKRSKGMQVQGETTVADLAELENLVNDPQQLMRRMSLDTARRSEDSGVEVPPSEDMPILPPGNQGLKRSTRTTYRRGSLKKGERVPFSKRAQQRHVDSDDNESPMQSPATVGGAPSQEEALPMRTSDEGEPILGLTRVQTEPTPAPPPASGEDQTQHSGHQARTSSRRRPTLGGSQSSDNIVGQAEAIVERQKKESLDDGGRRSPSTQVQQQQTSPTQETEPKPPQPQPEQQYEGPAQNQEQHQQFDARRPQPRQFHSRLASGPGRTTAQLPGYNNTNPLPNIIETLPDGTKVPVPAGTQADQQQPQQSPKFPERKSSHEQPRPMQRTGAHARPVPGAQRAGSTLNDISGRPSPLPGSSSTRTDALTMVPTFSDERKDKGKEGGRKSSWKWILGSDDDDSKDSKKADANGGDGGGKGVKSKVGSRLTKSQTAGANAKEAERARLDVLQNSIDGSQQQPSSRGRESLVLNRADIQLDDDSSSNNPSAATAQQPSKKSSSKKSSLDTSRKDKDKTSEKEPGLLQALFGSKKKTSDSDLSAAHDQAPSKKTKGHKKKDSDRRLSPEPPPRILKPDIDYNWTRFSILEERAIYRMAHIKLANPRRALYSQVLLSNFMYSYLAKVQMMHPQPIPGQTQAMQAARERERERAAQQREKGGAMDRELSEWQRWQEQQSRQEHLQYQQQQSGYPAEGDLVDSGDGNGSGGGGGYYNREAAQARANGIMTGQAAGYSVASGHDYLGYPKGEQPFGTAEGGGSSSGNGGGAGLWDEGEEVEDEDRGQRRGGGGGGMW